MQRCRGPLQYHAVSHRADCVVLFGPPESPNSHISLWGEALSWRGCTAGILRVIRAWQERQMRQQPRANRVSVRPPIVRSTQLLTALPMPSVTCQDALQRTFACETKRALSACQCSHNLLSGSHEAGQCFCSKPQETTRHIYGLRH